VEATNQMVGETHLHTPEEQEVPKEQEVGEEQEGSSSKESDELGA
jgi:hypothetical protein